MTVDTRLISQAEFARRIGISRQAISKAVTVGRITLTDKRIDPTAACRQLLKSTCDIRSPLMTSAVRERMKQQWPDAFAEVATRDADDQISAGPYLPDVHEDVLDAWIDRFTIELTGRLYHHLALTLKRMGWRPDRIWKILLSLENEVDELLCRFYADHRFTEDDTLVHMWVGCHQQSDRKEFFEWLDEPSRQYQSQNYKKRRVNP